MTIARLLDHRLEPRPEPARIIDEPTRQRGAAYLQLLCPALDDIDDWELREQRAIIRRASTSVVVAAASRSSIGHARTAAQR